MATYSVVMANATITSSFRDVLVYIRTDSTVTSKGSMIEVLAMWLNQIGTETPDQLAMVFDRWAPLTTPTLTAATPTPLSVGGPASGIVGGTTGGEGTAGTNCSTNGGGSVTHMMSQGFNNLNGWDWIATPEERFIVGPDTIIGLGIRTSGEGGPTPATLTGWNAGITYRELN